MALLVNEVDFSKFHFTDTRTYPGDTSSTTLLYDDGKFQLQTPVVYTHFGTSTYETDNVSGQSLSFNPDEELLAFFDTLDENLSQERTGKYIPIVRRRPNRPPLIRAKVDPSHVPPVSPRTRVRLILQLLPLWERNGKFGISFRVLKCQEVRISFRD